MNLLNKGIKLTLAAIAVSSFIVGCGGEEAKEAAPTASASQNSAAPAPAADPIILKFGYENNPGEPFDEGAKKWQELLNERSKGTMQIELYPSSQLGSKTDIIDSMILGEDVATLADGAFYSDRGVADFGIIFGPFLFDSWEEAFKLNNSQWFKDEEKLLNEKGIKIAAAFGLFSSLVVAMTGDTSAYQVARTQPMKLAAIEGLYDGGTRQGLTAIGVLNPSKERHDDGVEPFLFEWKMPYALSFLATRDADGYVPGINDIGIRLVRQAGGSYPHQSAEK